MSTACGDEHVCIFDCILIDSDFVVLCIYSVLWEPMGDGKRVMSLSDNHALLWDLQESSTQATVKYTHFPHCKSQNMQKHIDHITQLLTYYLMITI